MTRKRQIIRWLNGSFLILLLFITLSAQALHMHDRVNNDGSPPITFDQPDGIFNSPNAGHFMQQSPDGLLLSLSGNNRPYTVLLDYPNGHVRHVLNEGGCCVYINDDNTQFRKGNIIYDVSSGAQIADYSQHGTVIGSTDGFGQLLVSISNTEIQRIDADSGEVLQTYGGGVFNHADKSARISPDQSMIAFGIGGWTSSSRHTYLFDFETGAHLRTINSYTAAAAYNWSPDSQHIIIGSRVSNFSSHRVQIYEAATGSLFREHNTQGGSVTFSNDGTTYLVGGGSSGRVTLYNFATGATIWSTTKGRGSANAHFSQDGTEIISANSFDGRVNVFDAADGTFLRYLRNSHLGTNWTSLAGSRLSPDGAELTTFSNSNVTIGPPAHILTWQTEGNVLDQVLGENVIEGRVYDVAYSSDGSQLLAGQDANGQRVYLYDLDTGDASNPIPTSFHNTAVEVVAWSPDGRLAATGSGDTNTIYIWDTTTWSVVHTLQGNGGVFQDLHFSPDGTMLALGHSNISHDVVPAILVWDVSSGNLLYDLFNGWSYNISFSPDSNTLISGSWDNINPEDGAVRMWNMADGSLLRDFANIFPQNRRVAEFSPDGNQIIVGGDDEVVHIFDLTADRIAAEIHTIHDLISDAYWHPTENRVFIEGRGGTNEPQSITDWNLSDGIRLERDNPVELLPDIAQNGATNSANWTDYFIHTAVDRSLLISVTANITDSIQLYNQWNQQPTLGLYHDRALSPTAGGSYELLVPNTNGETLFVGAYGLQNTDFEIVARYVTRHLSDVTPRTVGNGANSLLTLTGLGFENSGMSASLCQNGNPVITATTHTLVEDGVLAADFDLTNTATGVYDLCLSWGDGGSVVLQDAVTIDAGVGANVEADLIIPAVYRDGRPYSGQLLFENSGNNSTLAPLLIVRTANNSDLKTACEQTYTNGPIQLLGVPESGIPTHLNPGQQGRASFSFIGDGTDIDFSVEIIDPTDTPIDWEAQKAEMRPTNMSQAEWDAIFPIFTAQLGDTWAEYIATLGRAAQRLQTRGGTPYCVRDLLTLELRKAKEVGAAAIAGNLYDADTLAPIQNGGIVAINDNHARSVDTNFVDGRFNLDGLPDGSYQIFAEGYEFDLPIFVTITNQTDLTDLALFATAIPEPDQIVDETIYLPDTNPVLTVDDNGMVNMVWERGGSIQHTQFDSEAGNWTLTQPITTSGSLPHVAFGETAVNNGAGLATVWSEGNGNDSQLYLALAQQKGDGSYIWSDPITITSDSHGDINPAVAILDDGSPLTLWLQRDFSIEDDTDLYFEKMAAQRQPFTPSQRILRHIFAPADLAAAESSQGGSLNLSAIVEIPDFVPVAGGKWGALVGGELTRSEVSCMLTDSAAFNAGLFLGGERYEVDAMGGGTYVIDTATPCKYVLQQAEVTLGTSIERPIGEIDRTFFKVIKVKIGGEFIGSANGNFTWAGANFPLGAPSEGVVVIDVTLKAEGSASATIKGRSVSGETNVTGRVRAGATFPINDSAGATYCIQIDSTIRAWILEMDLGYQIGAETLCTDDERVASVYNGVMPAGTRAVQELTQLTDGVPVTETLTLSVSPQVGTGNVYAGNPLLTTIALDTTDDGAPVVTHRSGETLAAWTKDAADPNVNVGSSVVVASYDGTTWSAPETVQGDSFFTRWQALDFVDGDEVMMVWSQATANVTLASSAEDVLNAIENSNVYYSRRVGGVWSAPTQVSGVAGTDEQTTVAGDGLGGALLAWVNEDNTIYTSFWDGVSWSSRVSPPKALGDVASVQVQYTGTITKTPLLVWSQGLDADDENGDDLTIFASTWDGSAWSTPIPLPKSDQVNPAPDVRMSLAASAVPASASFLPKPHPDCCEVGKDGRLVHAYDSQGRPLKNKFSRGVNSKDPNEKIGPLGFDGLGTIEANSEMDYQIFFENVMTATAPAQEVFITDTLPAELDWATVQFSTVAWGDETLFVEQTGNLFHARHTVADYRADVDELWWVDVRGEIDPATGVVTWVFRTLDPDTGELPIDALAGFLPPNDESGRGDGYVTFSVEQTSDLALGTTIDNFAEIVFDSNEPIITNTCQNTIGVPPLSNGTLYLPFIVR